MKKKKNQPLSPTQTNMHTSKITFLQSPARLSEHCDMCGVTQLPYCTPGRLGRALHTCVGGCELMEEASLLTSSRHRVPQHTRLHRAERALPLGCLSADTASLHRSALLRGLPSGIACRPLSQQKGKHTMVSRTGQVGWQGGSEDWLQHPRGPAPVWSCFVFF